MKLFLTGATGFVGRNLLLAALASGRYSRITAAVRDAEKLRRQLADEGVDAAQVDITGWEDPPPGDVDHAVLCAGVLFAREAASYHRVNVEDTLRFATALPRAARVLVLSSQSAGGPTPAGRAAREPGDPDSPLTHYGRSKLEMEKRLSQARPDAQIWRPPMILGPRDAATLPLFRMAAGRIRIKPGLRPKTYSWIAVNDLVTAVPANLFAHEWERLAGPLFVCSPGTITDLELIGTAASCLGRAGRTLPLPGAAIRVVSALVDAVPALRAGVPSLTRDRAKEIHPDRWVMDGSEFQRRFGGTGFTPLGEALQAACEWNARHGVFRVA